MNYPYGFHTASYSPPNAPNSEFATLPRQPTVRIYCEGSNNLSLTARNGAVVMATADSNDHYQHWIKDMTYSNDVRDSNGFPIFALVNRVTGEALRTPSEENQQVTLVPYNPDNFENSVQWTEGSMGFRAIRPADAAFLNLTADASCNIMDGTQVVLQEWKDTPVQHWKIVPYNANVPY